MKKRNVGKSYIQQYVDRIENYGGKFEKSRFLILLFVLLAIVVGSSIFYGIGIPLTCLVVVISVICTPFIFIYKFKYVYERKRYTELCSYMLQLIASYSKTCNILVALKDVYQTLEPGRMRSYVKEAINYIENGETKSLNRNIWEEALEPIENAYYCKRLAALHKFIIKVETEGSSDYVAALNILLADIHSWIDRTTLIQTERQNIRTYFGIGVVLSMGIGALSLFFRAYVDITLASLYAPVSCAFILACVLSFTLLQRILSMPWLEMKINERIIVDDYYFALEKKPKDVYKKLVPVYFILLGIAIIFFFLKVWILAIAPMAILILFLIYPVIKCRAAWDSTVREIKREFPEWLREVAITKQHQTVQMALAYSYETAPPLIKINLEQLLLELEENPDGVEPYNNFMRVWDIDEVKQAMKTLYSMTELGIDNINESLNMLMNRNYALLDRTEKEIAQNKLTLLKQLIAIPLYFATAKTLVDMFLFISIFFDQLGDINSIMGK